MALSLSESFERCCRLCAEEQEVTIMIFGEEAKEMLLQNKLNSYLLIDVDENDRLPKNICIQCCTKLQTVCDFIDTARNAQTLLMKRSIMLDKSSSEQEIPMSVVSITEIRSEPLSDDEYKVTKLEVNVDPMMVLQNSEEQITPTLNSEDDSESNIDNVNYLHGVSGENVTIKLIKKGSPSEPDLISKPFPCVTCKRSFVTELALKNHSWVHVNENRRKPKEYRCNYCQEGFDLKTDLMSHLNKHKAAGLCLICGRVFRTEKNLEEHTALHLSTQKVFTCKTCGRSYSTRSNLKTHSITHSNERPFQCHICKKSFKRNQDLKFHINQHTGAKPYKCPFCDKCFASSGNCYSHRSRMHPGKRVEAKIRGRPSLQKQNNGQHRTVAPKPQPVPVKGIFKYQCQLCEHSFIKRDNYMYHVYQHTGEKPFQCSFCSEKFVTRSGLSLHHDKAHPAKDRPLALISKNALLK